MGKILEKLMKKYWKNVKNTGKVYEKMLEKCKKKNWKSQGNSSVQKSGNHDLCRTSVPNGKSWNRPCSFLHNKDSKLLLVEPGSHIMIYDNKRKANQP